MSDVFDRTEMLTTREMNSFVAGLNAGSGGRTAVALACVAAMLLSACGGGGGGDTSVAAVVGTGAVTTSGSGSTAAVTTGTTTSSTSSAGTSSGTSSSSTTTTSSAVVTAPAVTAAAAPTVTRSISEWVTCGGVVDGAAGVARAVQAARNGAFKLNVDCPVLIKIGTDIAKPIFIDNDTTIQFTGTGLFTVDNVFVPAFAIVNSARVKLLDWRVQYVGSMPVDSATGGYYNNGVLVASGGSAPPSYMFNDIALKAWMTNNRQISFTDTNPYWTGPIGASAVFHIRGTTSDLMISGLKLFVPPSAGGHQFIPVAFSLTPGNLNGKSYSASTAYTADNFAIPTRITFDNIDLDGTIMGWQGNGKDVTFNKIRSHRYGDLQDAAGGNVGGMGKWFAPPHLFYLNYNINGDLNLANRNFTMTDVIDYGDRVGVARDRGNGDSISGYANSLKIGGYNITVNGYQSQRPDGLLDVLSCDVCTSSNITASYNSVFLGGIYPALRFPAFGYKNVIFRNVSVADTAAISGILPMGTARGTDNSNLLFENIKIRMVKWYNTSNQEMDLLSQTYGGSGHNIVIQHDFTPPGSSLPISVVSGKVQELGWTLTAAPSTLRAGASTNVAWRTVNASRCSNTAGFGTATTAIAGAQTVTSSVASTVAYGLSCVGIDGTVGLPTISATYTP
jgi:hypothetical protein